MCLFNFQFVETGTEDIAQLTSRLYDRYYNNQAYCRLHLSSSDAEQKKAAVTIQTEYRRHHAQLQTEEVRKEMAAVQIQSCYRGYRTRKALRTGDSGQQTWADEVEYPRECKREDNFISDEEASPEASILTQSEDNTPRKSYQDLNPDIERSESNTPFFYCRIRRVIQVPFDIILSYRWEEKPGKVTLALGAKINVGISVSEYQEKRWKRVRVISPVHIWTSCNMWPLIDTSGTVVTTCCSDCRNECLEVWNSRIELAMSSEVDINLEDPEVEKAALKIQAHYKGFKSCKKQTTPDPVCYCT
ncbi:sp17 protein [Clonorchis sinensis]|uniref:Sp17 protein n=1 Tax=Clonorchis sinensis TaxID=79923 RepID=G7YYW5_CLOSI|nr:sp17 protein [Clonorchis sinensis]